MEKSINVNSNTEIDTTNANLQAVCNRLFNDFDEIHNKFKDVRDAYDLLDFTREMVIDDNHMAYLPMINVAFFGLCDKMQQLEVEIDNSDVANKTVKHLRDVLLMASFDKGATV